MPIPTSTTATTIIRARQPAHETAHDPADSPADPAGQRGPDNHEDHVPHEGAERDETADETGERARYAPHP